MRWRAFQVVAMLASMLFVAFTSLSVTMRAHAMSVTPDSQSSGTLSTSTGYSASFTITYSGNELDPYPEDSVYIYCSGQGSLAGSCSFDTTSYMTIGTPEALGRVAPV